MKGSFKNIQKKLQMARPGTNKLPNGHVHTLSRHQMVEKISNQKIALMGDQSCWEKKPQAGKKQQDRCRGAETSGTCKHISQSTSHHCAGKATPERQLETNKQRPQTQMKWPPMPHQAWWAPSAGQLSSKSTPSLLGHEAAQHNIKPSES